MASAVISLSPVTMVISNPSFFRVSIAILEESLAISFAAIKPITSISFAKYIEVLPSLESLLFSS